MKKLPIVLTILAGCTLASNAATALRVVLADNTEKTFVLAKQPVVTYPGQDVTVTVDGVSATFARADVAKMDFTEVSESGVAEIVASGNALAYLNGTLQAADTEIAVYDLTGRLRLNGFGTLSLSSLPSGVYVAVAGGMTLKIAK